MLKRTLVLVVAMTALSAAASAQRGEVTVSLNEAFFDGMLDAIFQNFEPPEFSMADTRSQPADSRWSSSDKRSSFGPSNAAACETVRLLREMRGVRTAVRFRDGKVLVPLAFSGSYAPPLVGCVEFAGIAESSLEIEFDQNAQKLIGRLRVNSVNLNGTAGIGGTVIARMVQGSIDRKLNPIELMDLQKVSFGLPMHNSGTLRMRAAAIRPEVLAGELRIRIVYDFVKG